MKKLFSFMLIIFLSFAGLLVGCGEDRYANLTITIKTEQQRAPDGSITLYVGEDPEEITVTMGGIPDNFNLVPSFSLSENIVKIGEFNNMLDNGVRKTIEGIAPGTTVLTAYTSEGLKSTTLRINVIKKAEEISAKADYKLALLKRNGYEVTIDTSSALEIYPKDSNQNTVKYSLATEGLEDIVSLQDGKLKTLPGATATNIQEFLIKAEIVNHKGEVSTEVEPTYITARLIDDITSDDIKLYSSATDMVVNQSVLANPIVTTIVLSKNLQNNNATYVFVAVDTKENIKVTPPANVNSSPVMVSLVNKMQMLNTQYFVYRVQAIRYSKPITLNFDINVVGYESAFTFTTGFDVECQLYIKSFSVNDETIVEDGLNHHNIALFTNEQTSGSSVKISVADPREILASDAKFKVALYHVPTGNMIEYGDISKYFIISNASNHMPLTDTWYMKEVTFNIKLATGGAALDVEDSGDYKLTVVAERPYAYEKASTNIVINIVEGIKELNDITFDGKTYTNEQINILYETEHTPYEALVNCTPNSESAYSTLFAQSSNESIFTIRKAGTESNKFIITPLSVGEATVTFGSLNVAPDKYLSYRISVYNDIEDFYVSVDEFSQGRYIGKSEVEGNTLKSAVIKVNDASSESVDIKLGINPIPSTAKYYTIEYKVQRHDIKADTYEDLTIDGIKYVDEWFELNTTNHTFKFLKHNIDLEYNVTVTLKNYNGTEKPKTFTVSSYVPITFINMVLTEDVLYNPNNLGYFDINHPSKTYTKTQANVSVNRDATFGNKENINFDVVVDGQVTTELLKRNDTLFELNKDFPISKYPQKVYITAYALEFGKRIETTKQIMIYDPVTVESMAVEGDINGDILYFKLGVDNQKEIKVSLDPNVNLFNSNVKWVQYAEGTTDVLDYADNGTGLMPIVDVSNAIFSVEPKGNNKFDIIAKKAGNARLLLIPEDKIKDINGNKYVYNWDKVVELFVSVADGSKENPYHVANYADFRSIENAMDKYYVLTSNISIEAVEGNWVPLGYTNTTKTPLTGGINGRYSRIIDAYAGTRLYKQYEITDLSYASAASSLSHFGLLYGLGDSEHTEASLENLVVKYNFIQADFTQNLVFGGLVAVNNGVITNSKVVLTNAVISINGLSTIIGGLVGENSGDIDNSGIDNSVNLKMTIRIKTTNIIGMYAGGLVGKMTAGTLSGSQKDYTELDSVDLSFGDQSYDALLNITVTSDEELSSISRDATVVGGVVGYIANTESTEAAVNDFAIQGDINASVCNNVGGIVGRITGVLYKNPDTKAEYNGINLYNNTNNAKIVGHTYVGGVVGKATYANFRYCSAENYKETQTTPRAFVTGQNYVAGFGGYIEACNINRSFFVTYFDNAEDFTTDKVSDQTSDIICTADNECYVGGFIASMSLVDGNMVDGVAFIGNIYVASSNVSNSAGIFGYYNGIGSVGSALARGYASSGVGTSCGANSARISASNYYSTINKSDVTSLVEVLDKAGEFIAPMWGENASINDGLPYLLDEAGNILFAFLPINIEFEIIENGGGDPDLVEESLRNDGYVDISDATNEVVVLYLNELKTGELTAEQLLALNSYEITDFATLAISPRTNKTVRLMITSNNTSVVRVSNSKLIAVKEGYSRVTISSKLNANYKVEFIVVVRYGFNEYSLYESSNLSAETLVKDDINEPIEIIVNKVKALYEEISYDRVVDGQTYSLRNADNVYVRFTLENEEYKDSFIINSSWQISDDATYNEVAVNTLTSIFAKIVMKNADGHKLPPVKITAVPYVTYNYLANVTTYYYTYLTKSFYVLVSNGASSISFDSESTNVEITELQGFRFGVNMVTDTNDDAILYTVKYNGEIIDIKTLDTTIDLATAPGSDLTITDPVTNEVTKKVCGYVVTFKNESDIIKENRPYEITFYSKLVPSISTTMTVTVVPQNIVSADIGLYTDTKDYNANKDGTEKFIFNGEDALLTVEIYPNFSLFDRFDIVYTSDTGSTLSIGQLKYNKNATADDEPFEDYINSGSQYIKGYGMKVQKATGDVPLLGSGSGIFSYSSIYYFSLLVGSEVPDLTNYKVSLVFFSDGKVVEPTTISYSFQTLSQPAVSLEVKNKTLNNLLPVGTKNEIEVTTQNFTGDIAWEVEINQGRASNTELNCNKPTPEEKCGKCITCLNENYALLDSLIPTLDADGKYYMTIPKDNFDLVGNSITVTATIEKHESNNTFKASATMRVEVTLFTVTGMTVEGLSLDVLKLQIYTPYSLQVSLNAFYSDEVMYKRPMEKDPYPIANMVAKLREQVSAANIWSLVLENSSIKLEKGSPTLYNAAFECISYGDYYALYGHTVDIISKISAVSRIGYDSGEPKFYDEEEAAKTENAKFNIGMFTKTFTVSFTYQNDIKNPIPITTADEFLAMEEGKDYRLTSDILLTDYTPLSTRILSLDGNGYTIYISSFANDIADPNLGLFTTLRAADDTMEATMIYNVKVYYIENPVIKESIAAGGNTVYEYSIPTIRNHVSINATAFTEYNFGGIAGTNNGIITNCHVQGLLKISADSDNLTASYVGGLSGINSGFITASKVYDFTLTSSGNMGGVAGKNTNKISATYTDELELNNESTNTQLFYTGGFVCENEEGATIIESYVQGKRDSLDETIVNTKNSLVTSGTAGGFVYLNKGNINDCYSNIAINASAYSAGFVFLNEENAIVNNCYSISRVAFNSRAASPFTGIGKSGGVTVFYEGQITNCFYLTAEYNNFTNEPAIRLKLSDFLETASFGTFNFRFNTTKPEEAEGYTWYIAGGKPRLTQTDISTSSIYTYVGKTKNYTANSEVYFKFQTSSGKWYAYSVANGYDTTKEMVINRRATLAFYETYSHNISTDTYYFTPSLDATFNQKVNERGEKLFKTNAPDNDKEYYLAYNSSGNLCMKCNTEESEINIIINKFYFKRAYDGNTAMMHGDRPLYDTMDSNTTGKKYYLSQTTLGGNTIDVMVNSGNVNDIIPVSFEYYDEIYTEEEGVIHSGLSMWKNISTDQVLVKVDGRNPLLEYEGSNGLDFSVKYIMSIDITSVTYNDGGTTNLVDLSVDSEGQCDLTYIKTVTELGLASGETAAYINQNYGGCYSYRKLDSVRYHYALTGEGLGSKNNPYLIYDTVSYNTYFTDKFTNPDIVTNNKREYYRFVADIDFDFKNITTSNKILYGFVEGNGMAVKNITLTYVSGDSETVAFGLFSQSYNSMVSNLIIEVIEIASSAHTYVGGLVGWASTAVTETTKVVQAGPPQITETYNAFNGVKIADYSTISSKTYLMRNYFNNIKVIKTEKQNLDNTGLVLGRNFVGGLVGYMTGIGKVNNIITEVNVNAAYIVDTDKNGKYRTYQRVETTDDVNVMKSMYGDLKTGEGTDAVAYTKDQWLYHNNRNIAYAGMAIGVIDCDFNEAIYNADLTYGEGYVVNKVTVRDKITGAGHIIGGVIGYVAKDNIVNNINFVVNDEQSIRGIMYAGGLVGENRGSIQSSTIAYAEKKENEVAVVTSIRSNKTFFNNNAATTAIGGLIGFNNGGTVNSCISHIDVRNPLATVAGGAVGRSIKGSYNKVIVSGSVRAASIVGGFVGTVNTTFAYTGKMGIGCEEQIRYYPADGTTATDDFILTSSFSDTDVYVSCIAANNWHIDDYPYLTEKQNIRRVSGGFIGSQSLDYHYYDNLDDTDIPIENVLRTEYTKIYPTFENCFYTHSLYYGSAGDNVSPAAYMPVAYITNFDSVRLFTSRYDVNTLYNYQYPFIALTTLNQTNAQSHTLVGMTHYEMAYGGYKTYEGELVKQIIVDTDNVATDATKGSYVKVIHVYSPSEGTSSTKWVTRDEIIYGAKTESAYETDNGGNAKLTYNLTERPYDFSWDANKEKYTMTSDCFKIEITVPSGKTFAESTGRKVQIKEKYFIYESFYSSEDFTFADDFLNANTDTSYTQYPSINIKSSQFEWKNYQGTEFSSKDDYYLIESASDLARLAYLVNNKDTAIANAYNDKKYLLTTDIDLTGKQWTSIGGIVNVENAGQPARYERRVFKGEFDGNGKTIGYIANQGGQYGGVFGIVEGSIAKSAIIKNLTCAGGTINGMYAGGIAGEAKYTTFSNCHNTNTVIGSYAAGGITAKAESCIFTNVYNRGRITIETDELDGEVSSFAGGLVGRLEAGSSLEYKTVTNLNNIVNIGEINVKNEETSYTSSETKSIGNVYVGGFVGFLNGSSIANVFKTDGFVYNKGKITVTTNAHNILVGGAFGYAIVAGHTEDTNKALHIAQIRNNGNITINDSNVYATKKTESYDSGAFGIDYVDTTTTIPIATINVGGVIGKFAFTNSVGRVGRLANNGTIVFENQKQSKSIGGVGGIIGSIENGSGKSSVEQSYNSTNIDVTVSAGKANINVGVGGIVGFATKTANGSVYGTIDNCYNMGTINSRGSGGLWTGGIFGIASVTNINEITKHYALGNGTDILNNALTVNGDVVKISNCYNIASVTGETTNEYGVGALLGYGVGASCERYNYYLNGVAEYAFAEYSVVVLEEPDEDGNTEQLNEEFHTTSVNSYEQRTTNTLKLNFSEKSIEGIGVKFTDYDSYWEQKVDTWYPTLKNNYEVLYWNDNYSNLSVEGDTFTIDTAEKLAYLSYAVNNGIIDSTGVKFALTDNIDMSNRYFTPIGNSNYPFRGFFNGNGYSIKNITINPTSAVESYIRDPNTNEILEIETVGSLFGYTNNASITNVGLVSPIIKNIDYATGIAYKLENNGVIEYCFIDSFEITDPDVVSMPGAEEFLYKEGLISGYKKVAGLAIEVSNSNISRSYVNVPLDATYGTEEKDYQAYLAGFAVEVNMSTISDCYVGEGLRNGIFTYVSNVNETLGATLKFNKFINIENGIPVALNGSIGLDENSQFIYASSIYHCYNLTKLIEPGYFDGTNVQTKDEDAIALTSGVNNGDIIPTSNNLKAAGWDIIDVWSYEYSLLGDISENSNYPATIRGLGQNWYNTECEDLVLRNNVGNSILEKDSVDLTGNKQYFIYYEITTAEELAWIARMVNTGKLRGKDGSGTQYVVKLMNDINLLHRTWTPIGTMEFPFACKFDFNGYEISNLVIDTANIGFGGLFGYTNGAVITNGYLTNSYINIDVTSEDYNSLNSITSLYIGSVVGKGHNTQIADIVATSNLVGYSRYNVYVGGIAGSVTFGKSSDTDSVTSSVTNVQVSSPVGSEVLIPSDYRLNDGFGIDEVLTEANKNNYLRVNIGGFSSAGNSYVGGVAGYVSGKYTKEYTTEALIEKAYNASNIVSYSHSDISRTYAGGIAGYMTENSILSITESIASIKTATYGFDYIGGLAGMVDGGSQIINSVNKGHLECSQFASVLSYAGGVSGYLRGGSRIEKSVNYGSSYRNIDSTKIFSAGAIGYVERDITGAMPVVLDVVYRDLDKSYEDESGNTIGYYGDGELIPAEEGRITVKLIGALTETGVTEFFSADIWDKGAGDVKYSTTYKVEFDDKVVVFVVTRVEDAVTYTKIETDRPLAMGTELIIVTKDKTQKITVTANSITREYTSNIGAIVTGDSLTIDNTATSEHFNAIAIKNLAGGIQITTSAVATE